MKMTRHDPEQWLRKLFTAIDANDLPRFLEFLADDARFRFGNRPACQGKQAVGAAVGGFFGAIKGCRHELQAFWVHADSVVCHGQVTYTRHDGSALTVPFADVLTLRDGLVLDYLIFVDASSLFGVPGENRGT